VRPPFVSVVSLIIFGSLFALPVAAQDTLRIVAGRAGRFEIGMSIDDVYASVGRERVRLIDRFSEGMFTPAIEISLVGAPVSPSIIAPIREWPCPGFSIWGIEVLDPRFRTNEEIGVGSTLGELRRQYSVRLSEEEGPHAWVESLHLNFQLADASRSDSIRITSVWIPIRDPAAVRARRCPQLGPIGRPNRPSNEER
jgi:hypothetical protein